ncbi:MAG: divergent polysaccharide deacetylase family protein [Candidatus Atribacteria bacterium]|nr:divergent polysaccharide deacetylase family protein [Candidatus Atribacteria bacterium]MCD6350042.1 divergent polysaccharide deacetylase family protein [Candidatus Atribacteria bacterium]
MSENQWKYWNKIFLTLIIALLFWGVFLFGKELFQRETQAGSFYGNKPVLSSREERKWLALFVFYESRKYLSGLQIKENLKENLVQWQAKGVLDNVSLFESFEEKMGWLVEVLRHLDYYGEIRKSKDSLRVLFFKELWPWLDFEVRLLPSYKLVLIIDDFGYNFSVAQKFMDLPLKLNVAIFPHLRLSASLSRLAREKGKEVLIHFPMEAQDPEQNKGEDFMLREEATEEVIEDMLERAFDCVVFARGLNNHKGSLATANPQLMQRFFSVFSKRKGVYFVDSLTSPDSVACKVALEYGVPCISRDVFIDGVYEEGYILNKLHEAAALARKRGFAVAIGHVNEVTYNALSKFAREVQQEEGLGLVFVSDLLLYLGGKE